MKKRVKLRSGTRIIAQPVANVSIAPAPWDTGARGPANRARHARVEDAIDADPETGEVRNPNGVKHIRYVDMLEIWYRDGMLSAAAFNAAERLRDAFEATQQAPGWPDNDRVQSSPKPDHAVTIQIDRLSRFHAVNRLVPPADRPMIEACVLGNHTPMWAFREYRDSPTAGIYALAAALERLAKAMDR
jgi:hypothetical protein